MPQRRIVDRQYNPGCILIVLWERWDSRPDYEAYLSWRMETGFMEALGPFMEGDPVFSYFDDVDA